MEQTNVSLYDDKLVEITGSLIERYNQALDSLGIERTNLQSFTIDAYGWSPEIAKEKENESYLSHGENIPYGIIITAEQFICSMIYSHHTFDKRLMDAVFAKHGEKIKEMTLWTSIIVSMTTGIGSVQSPIDLLKWSEIKVTCSIPYFIKKAQEEQQKLIDIFNQDDNCLNEDIHNQLLQSAVKYGDLRGKEFKFDDITIAIGTFYTKAFGGVYIIRKGTHCMIVCNSRTTLKKCLSIAPDGVVVYHIDDVEVTKALKQWKVIAIQINEEQLRFLSNVHLGLVVSKQLPEAIKLEDVFNNGALKQKYYDLNKAKLDLCLEYRKIRDSFRKLLPAQPEVLVNMLSENGVVEVLYAPYKDLPEDENSTIWQLLTDRTFENFTMLYRHNRVYFEQLYVKWPKAFQEWVMSVIKTVMLYQHNKPEFDKLFTSSSAQYQEWLTNMVK